MCGMKIVDCLDNIREQYDLDGTHKINLKDAREYIEKLEKEIVEIRDERDDARNAANKAERIITEGTLVEAEGVQLIIIPLYNTQPIRKSEGKALTNPEE